MFKAVHFLPSHSYVPLCSTLIPFATLVVYHWARNNLQQNIKTPKDVLPGSPKMKQKEAQYRLFVILEGAETVTFLALSFFNRYYLIPSCFSLAHLFLIK